MNCSYANHDLKKKSEPVEMDDGSGLVEMECSKCGISTYYPEEAFNQSEGETFEEVADSI